LKSRERFRTTIIEVCDRIDITIATTLDKTINYIIDDTKIFVFDFKGLKYISSAGIRVLLKAHNKIKNNGLMKIVNIFEEVMNVFKITEVIDFLIIEYLIYLFYVMEV
jgi:anti-anti-sigma factor